MSVPDFRLRPRTSGLFAWSAWDALSVTGGCAHLAFMVWIVAGWAHRPWWANLLCGLGYAFAGAWNIDSVAHNFIPTPDFRWAPLNHAFSHAIETSHTLGFLAPINRRPAQRTPESAA